MSDGVGITRGRAAALSVAGIVLGCGVWTMIRDAAMTPERGIIQSADRGERPVLLEHVTHERAHTSLASVRSRSQASGGAVSSPAARLPHQRDVDALEASIAEARSGSMPVTPLTDDVPGATPALAIRLIEAQPVEPGAGTWRLSLAVVNVSDGMLGAAGFTLSCDGQPVGGGARFTVRPLPRGRGDMVVVLVDGLSQDFDPARLSARIVSHGDRIATAE